MRRSIGGAAEKPRPMFTWEQMDELLREEGLHATEEEVPASAFSAREFISRYKVPETTARYRLRQLVIRGHLRVGRRVEADQLGRRKVVNVYWKP